MNLNEATTFIPLGYYFIGPGGKLLSSGNYEPGSTFAKLPRDISWQGAHSW